MHRLACLLVLALAAPAAADPAAEPLRPGLRVKAKGRFDAAGFVADRVRVHDAADDDVEIAGAIDAFDDATDRFRVGPVWIHPDEDELDRASRRRVRALDAGDFVKAEGALDPDGTLRADTLERPDAEEPSIEGIVTAVEPAADGARVLRIGALAIAVPAAAIVEGAR